MVDFLNFFTNIIYFSLLIALYNCNIIYINSINKYYIKNIYHKKYCYIYINPKYIILIIIYINILLQLFNISN